MSVGLQTAHSFECTTAREWRLRYLLFLPQDYDALSTSWPLILFLHGSGERGTRLAKVAAHGPPKVVQHRPDFPFIVVSPQCSSGELWSREVLLLLLEHLLENYRIDRGRVYLTGLSMGGYGAWSLALAHPERFAAVTPICGGGNLLPILLASPRQLRALRTLGVWAFHGAKDPVVTLGESERMVAALRTVGNHARLTIYPEAEHDSWTETYDNPALYRWLLSHHRPRAAGAKRP